MPQTNNTKNKNTFLNSLLGKKFFRKILLISIALSFLPIAFLYSIIRFSTQHTKGVKILSWNLNFHLTSIEQQFFPAIILTAAILLAVITWTWKNILKPLFITTEKIKKISEGDLEISFDTDYKGALSELSTILNNTVLSLKEQKEREIFASKLKTEFLSIAAHQLRTPLATVKWILKMILDEELGPVSEAQHDFMEKGYSANERMIDLVNGLLDVNRMEEGRFGFNFSVSDFNKTLLESIKNFEEYSTIKNINYKYSLPSSPVFVVFDPQRIKMVITNLIDNAMRYTPPRGIVEVTTSIKHDFIQVAVKDSGVGIPKEQASKIFSKFFRADNVIRIQTIGTGLGLYLTKNIVEKHGGKIWFDSKENKGSTFYFTLPRHTEDIYDTELIR